MKTLHGLLPDLWGLVFARLPPRDLLQVLLVDKAFSAEVRREKHWLHRVPNTVGTLSFFTHLSRLARQPGYTHLLELSYYCVTLSLGVPVNWLPEYTGQMVIVVQKNGVSYEIRHTPLSHVVQIMYPTLHGWYANLFARLDLIAYAETFMAMSSGVPKLFIIN